MDESERAILRELEETVRLLNAHRPALSRLCGSIDAPHCSSAAAQAAVDWLDSPTGRLPSTRTYGEMLVVEMELRNQFQDVVRVARDMEMRAVAAEALVLSHEGHIAALERNGANLRDVLIRAHEMASGNFIQSDTEMRRRIGVLLDKTIDADPAMRGFLGRDPEAGNDALTGDGSLKPIVEE